jgi:alpha-tubulin suppressor-like RCC1 family protein
MVLLQSNSTLWAWGNNNNGQLGLSDINRSSMVQITIGSNWSKINCGYTHTIALQSNGTLWDLGS